MNKIFKPQFNHSIASSVRYRLTIIFAMLACLGNFCPEANAQLTFDISRKVEGGEFPQDLAIGDFDNNGFKDIAYITSPDGELNTLYNDGTFNYTTSSIVAGGAGHDYLLAVADFNEDGKSDLAIINRNSPVNERLIILISTGTSFTKFNFSIPGPIDIYAVSTEDFDNDGHADVLVPNMGQALTWYKGNGLGGFSQQTDNTIIGGSSIVVTDFNNDSKKDLAIGSGFQLNIYLSSGTVLVKTTVDLIARPSKLIATDINNDNSMDIVGSFYFSSEQLASLTNNGAGVFSSLVMIPTPTTATSSLASADYNGDGLQDLAIATYNGTGPGILLNTGGAFANNPFSDERVNSINNLMFADLDNMGGPELVCLSYSPSLSVLKTVNGSFQLVHKEILGNMPLRGLARDVDHNGKVDLVNPSTQNGAAIIKRGNGDLTFGGNAFILGTGDMVEYVETSDFNSDGYDDILFTERYLSGETKVKLSLTDIQGNYQTPFEISQASGIVIAEDFNMDGKQDFFCPTGVFLGNGAGAFNQQPKIFDTQGGAYLYYVKIANLNNDGLPDLVVGNAFNAWTLLNSGNGNFADPVTLDSPRRIARVEVGHYDTDDLSDIFTISDNTFSAFKNMGNGTFQEFPFTVEQPLTVTIENVFTIADFNQDGLGDFAIRVNRNNSGIDVPEIAVYLQQQDNTYKLKTELISQLDGQQDLTSADMNNDGSADLIGFSVGNGIEIFPGYFIPEPTVQAGPISILDRTDVTVKLGFTKGSGDGRLVVLRKNTFPARLPEDEEFYFANSQFGQGENIGNSNFVVLRGDQTEVTITGLEAGTDYVATVFEYRDYLEKSINNYLTDPFATLSFKTKINQTISFLPINSKTQGDPSFTLTAQASSGLPVEFSSSNTNVVLTQAQVSITGPGLVTITASQGGNEDYMPALVVSHTFCINPMQPVITISESGSQIILTSSSGSNNQWMLNEQPIPGAINTTYVVKASGTYTVKVDYDGCSASSTPDIVTGVNEIMKTVVSPNPAFSLLILHGIEVRAVTLTSTKGDQFQLSAEVTDGESRVDVSVLSAGIYILSTGTGAYAKVLINR